MCVCVCVCVCVCARTHACMCVHMLCNVLPLFCDSQRSTTMFFDMKHEVKLVYFDPTKGHLLTVGSDRVVKVRTLL